MKCSVVINPSTYIVEYIRQKKDLLKESIGWFHSVNSNAHISICEFETDDIGYKKCLDLIHLLAEYEKEQYVYLTAYKSYPNGTFYIEPAYYSKAYLKEVFRRVLRHLHAHLDQVVDKSIDPHLSIAICLDVDNLKIAKKIMTHIDESFLCNSFALRVFNPESQQYDIIDKIPFGNKIREDGQLSLFK